MLSIVNSKFNQTVICDYSQPRIPVVNTGSGFRNLVQVTLIEYILFLRFVALYRFELIVRCLS